MNHDFTQTDPNDAEILRQRATALAQPPAPVRAEERLALVQFQLADERYAVEQRHVLGVHPLKQLTPLPCTPPHVRGIAALRGHIVPVLDLRRLFGLPERGLADLHRVVEVRVGPMHFGLLTDLAVDVGSVAVAALQRGLPSLAVRADYLLGITPDGLLALDLERIAADPRLLVDEEVPLT